ncbi:DNA polymerase IV [Alkalibacter rhizosphaerae]|uniref:DNA polymerase IV n=1 Tax=Alkalibacter rhizosphaerae TaxID=2815577 RepID=A0A975AHA3_9FIRM|nr:DNA polymerase IV [Alkalibacter rhizosphaerae]QSX07793.1 DNA polymerase IV [Alkalibacter rhizosphaerae]
MDRLVFLVDMNAFYISCETVRQPHLKDGPSAVAGDPRKRTGIILAANYNARGYGVRTAMSVYQALKLCPDLKLVAPDHDYYSQKSREVMDLLDRFSPTVEQNSIDEAWLDITGSHKLFGPPMEAATTIQDAIHQELGLDCSIGISSNKFLAKMAAEMKKPRGITALFPADLEEKLWPLPLGKVWGIGSKTAKKLNDMGLFTIGELARSDPSLLQDRLGKHGWDLHQHVNGLDEAPVTAHDRDDVKSIGKSVTLSEDLTNLEMAKQILFSLSDQVGRRARRKGKEGTTVQITIKYTDFQTITRQQRVDPTNSSRDVFQTACRLLEAHWKGRRPLRLLGVTLADFHREPDVEQLSMFPSVQEEAKDHEKHRDLEKAMDKIRDKYGSTAITHAILLAKNKDKK